MNPFAGRLEDIAPLYDLPEDNIVEEVLIPAIGLADDVAIASGFFSSCALAKIAPGMAGALKARARFRVLLSPQLSDEDLERTEPRPQIAPGCGGRCRGSPASGR